MNRLHAVKVLGRPLARELSSTSPIHKVMIVGGGPAGYTAGIYAARAMLNPVILAGVQHGGQLMLTTEVENFPGYPKGVSGPQLMDDMRLQAEHNGASIINNDVQQLKRTDDHYTLTSTSGDAYRTKSVIIATGAAARWLGAKNEELFQGKGVSTCATCDGFFHRGRDVVVVGGGDTAIEEALYLSHMCKNVYLIHRRQTFRASKVQLDRARRAPNIHLILDSVVDEWLPSGDNSDVLGGVSVKNTITGETRTINDISGGFIAIGHIPNTSFLQSSASGIELDNEGYITAPQRCMTSLPGVFAAGDVVDKRYRQAVTAAGMGCMAAMEAERWLTEQS